MFKTANVGSVDRIIRGAILIALPNVYTSPMWANGAIRWAVPVVGLVLVLTALFRFCPAYRLFGASTCKAK
jgi:hypothetical protein